MRLTEFIESKIELTLLQVRVSKDLVDKVKIQMKKDGLKWADLIEAALKLYLKESDLKNK